LLQKKQILATTQNTTRHTYLCTLW